jgi:hypothetical protein
MDGAVATPSMLQNREYKMTNDAIPATALAARKARLLLDGAVYRAGIIHAKAAVVHSSRAESLIHNAVEHAFGFAGARLEAVLAPTGGRFQALLPVAFAAFSYLLRKGLVKPVLGAGLVVAAVAAVAAVAGRRNRASDAPD